MFEGRTVFVVIVFRALKSYVCYGLPANMKNLNPNLG